MEIKNWIINTMNTRGLRIAYDGAWPGPALKYRFEVTVDDKYVSCDDMKQRNDVLSEYSGTKTSGTKTINKLELTMMRAEGKDPPKIELSLLKENCILSKDNELPLEMIQDQFLRILDQQMENRQKNPEEDSLSGGEGPKRLKRRKSNKRKSTRRKSTRRKSTKRKSIKRKSKSRRRR